MFKNTCPKDRNLMKVFPRIPITCKRQTSSPSTLVPENTHPEMVPRSWFWKMIFVILKMIQLGGGNWNIFYFHPYLVGKMNPFWLIFFEMGLVQPPTSKWSKFPGYLIFWRRKKVWSTHFAEKFTFQLGGWAAHWLKKRLVRRDSNL